MTNNQPITEEYAKYMKENYSDRYDFIWYRKYGSMDVVDLNGNFIAKLNTMKDCESFESSIKSKG